MDVIRITGGRPLKGTVSVSGSKNATLPIVFATLLCDGDFVLENVPDLRDVRTACKLLSHLGIATDFKPPSLIIKSTAPKVMEAPYQVVKEMRASVLVLGPLLARFGEARVSLPGGCAIGARPIDQHLKGLEAMGTKVVLKEGYVSATVPGGRLRGAEIDFDVATVTGTENLLCAASLADGTTILRNAAKEPEIVDLARFLKCMGAKIHGEGTKTITIEGVEKLSPAKYRIMADRIEAGTFMVAAAATGGDVFVEGAHVEELGAFVDAMKHAGVKLEAHSKGIHVSGAPPFEPTNITTAPYPGFATDMQAQFIVLMSLAKGKSVIEETIFENRFMHVAELLRMGANIRTRGHFAYIEGVHQLTGATVMATDLRASASLVIAALVAEGATDILRVYHLDRGYEHIEQKLAGLGARIERVAGRG